MGSARSLVSRFFLWSYLNVCGNKYEVGTVALYKAESLWTGISRLVMEELASYHATSQAKLTKEQTEFAFDALIPFIKAIFQKHLKADEVAQSGQVLQAIMAPVCAFADNVAQDLSNEKHLKTLCSFMMSYSAATHGAVSPTIVRKISDKLQHYQDGNVLESAAVAK
jgi:hypothetical protein